MNAANCRLPTSRGAITYPKERRQLRKAPTPETVQTIDREKPSREQKQEQFIEPGHYFGISR